VLGVTGGVAAYKSVQLARDLTRLGGVVDVVLTESAQRFVTPFSFEAVTGRPALTDMFSAEGAALHVRLGRDADVVCVAPATADFLARLAAGMADDLLTTVCLATAAPLCVAPAMNRQMWANPATQSNVATLRQRGLFIHGPASGEQACGETGEGRMLEPLELATLVLDSLEAARPLAGTKVVITAGPTREPIDPVRFVSNRSSGKMGYAVAQAAREAGAHVVLVSGPVSLPAPPGVVRVMVETAQEMYDAVHAAIRDADFYIGAAAIADYRPAAVAPSKIKKRADTMTLEMVRAPDILASVAALERRPFVVGFAAETQDVEQNALAKLRGKRLDLVAANRVGEGLAFDQDENALLLLWEGGREELATCGKLELARKLVARIASRRAADTELPANVVRVRR